MDDQERLIHAARCGDLDGIKSCVPAGNLNAEGPLGMTALGEACRAGQIEAVRFLIEAGADIGDVLHLACEYKGIDMVNVLVASGVSVDSVDKYGRTPLHTAVERQDVHIVEALLKQGAAVDKVDRQSCQSPLHIACKTEYVAIVTVLLAYGAQTNLKNTSSHTPLHIACTWNKSLDVVITLLNHGALIDEIDRYGDTALHTACYRGRLDMVRLLLQHGASVDVHNKRHLTSLRLAFEFEPIISLLLDYGIGTQQCTLYSCPCNTTVLLCEYEFHCSCFDHVDMFEKHFIKVGAADIHYTAKPQWDPIDSERWGQPERDLFSASCSAEIEKTKTHEIGDSKCTYYDLLCRKKSALLNENIIGRLSLEALEKFPIYGDMIYCSYLKIPECLRRRDLMEKCSAFFKLTPFSQLPLELVPLILEYLPDVDLEHLVDICEGSRRQSGLANSPSRTIANYQQGSDVAERLNAMSLSESSVT